MLHIRTKSVRVESASSMTIVERYHALIGRVFKIIRTEAAELDKEKTLQMAVKARADSVNLNRLVLTLLLFGVLPLLKLPTDDHTPSTFKRAIALEKIQQRKVKTFCIQTSLTSTVNEK